MGRQLQKGWLDQALRSAELMQQQGTHISTDLAYTLVHECSKQQDLETNRRMHSLVIDRGFDSVANLADYLIRQFAYCGRLGEANQVFSKVEAPSEYTWNAIIAAHAKIGHGDIAIYLYDTMKHGGRNANKFTVLGLLRACSGVGGIEQGRHIHDQIIENGFQSDIIIGSTLVDMYAKCAKLEEARRIFDNLPERDVVAWGAMITGYAQHGQGNLALECFENMQEDGINPDKVIFLSTLKACASIAAIDQGRQIHKQVIDFGLHLDTVVGNALIDMYAKCGNFEEARKIFDSLPKRDIISWGAMISGYAKHGAGFLALQCFENMKQQGIEPSKITISSALKACSSIGAIDKGRCIHKVVAKSGLLSDIVVGNALVDMYVKCGSMVEARKVFEELPSRDVVTWSSMIAGYAQCGQSNLAGYYLRKMQQEGFRPNEVTFATILGACSRAGLVNQGYEYLKSMRKIHGIEPDIRHYNCMVDLLGRTARLNEAEFFLGSVQLNDIGLTSLLAACRTYGNVELARRCFDHVVKIDPHNAAVYVLMSGIYSDACMWQDAMKIEELRQHTGAWKKPAKAWIEVNDNVHEFIVGDKSHPQSAEIYNTLKVLCEKRKDAGYTPKFSLDEDKEDALCGHSEKLAIAFGLISTPVGTSIRATKNLRVCLDCHNMMKFISKVEKREIIIKDSYCFHQFSCGSCSCGDML